MNKILFLLTVLLFASCSSTPNKGQSAGMSTGEEEKRLGGIKNEDFRPKKEIPYLPQEDNLEKYRLSSAKEDALATESLQRADKDDWEKVKDPQDPLSRMAALCYQAKFDEAFALIDEKYDEYKKHPPYWNQVGTCHFLQGKILSARLYYNRAVELDKDYAPAINNLGLLYLKENKDQKALTAFRLALDKNPFSLTPAFNLAQLYLRYGLINESLEKFKVLHSQNPADQDVLAGLGMIELLRGEAESALKYFTRLDGPHLGRPEVIINYSLALKLAGKGQEGSDLLKKADLPPDSPWKEYYSSVSKFIGEKL